MQRVTFYEFSTVTDTQARSVSSLGAIRELKGIDIRSQERFKDTPNSKEGVNSLYQVKRWVVLFRCTESVFVHTATLPVWVLADRLRAELDLLLDSKIDFDYRFGKGTIVIERHPLRRMPKGARARHMFAETQWPILFSEESKPLSKWSSPWTAVAARTRSTVKNPTDLTTWTEISGIADSISMSRAGGSGFTSGTCQQRYDQCQNKINPISLSGIGGVRSSKSKPYTSGDPVGSRGAASLLHNEFLDTGLDADMAVVANYFAPPVADDFLGLGHFAKAVVGIGIEKSLLDQNECADSFALNKAHLCAAQKKKQAYGFVDPTGLACQFGESESKLSAARALVIKKRPLWVDVPTMNPEQSYRVMRSNLGGKLEGDAHLWLKRIPAHPAPDKLKANKKPKTLVGNKRLLKEK